MYFDSFEPKSQKLFLIILQSRTPKFNSDFKIKKDALGEEHKRGEGEKELKER